MPTLSIDPAMGRTG